MPPRRMLLLCGVFMLVVVVLLPPYATLARRYVFVETLQFGLLSIVVPALVVLLAPWEMLLRSTTGSTHGPNDPDRGGRLARSAVQRRQHPGSLRSLAYLALYIGTSLAWRLPGSVDALARSPALSILETVTLVAAGVLFWLELVPSAPFAPRLARPMRVALATIAMWCVWIIGYVLGMSHAPWFDAFVHSRRSMVSDVADQQLAAGILWAVAALGYVPFIFASLIAWLGDSEDSDDELRRIVRDENRRRRWTDPRADRAAPRSSR